MKNKKVNIRIYINIVIAVIIMIYFISINFAYYKVEENNLLILLKVFSMIILSIAIALIEIAYRKDNGNIAINSVEAIVLAGYTLSITHVVNSQKINFANYILISSYMFSIYYLLKAIIVYTKERKEFLNSLSDIREIVSNTPIKKEATKKNK